MRKGSEGSGRERLEDCTYPASSDEGFQLILHAEASMRKEGVISVLWYINCMTLSIVDGFTLISFLVVKVSLRYLTFLISWQDS